MAAKYLHDFSSLYCFMRKDYIMNIMTTEIFVKHQNVNKHSFFVGLRQPIIIDGRKTNNPRFYCFVLIVMFYTKEISYIFITLGNVCNYNLSRIDEKFNLRYDEKKIDINKAWIN